MSSTITSATSLPCHSCLIIYCYIPHPQFPTLEDPKAPFNQIHQLLSNTSSTNTLPSKHSSNKHSKSSHYSYRHFPLIQSHISYQCLNNHQCPTPHILSNRSNATTTVIMPLQCLILHTTWQTSTPLLKHFLHTSACYSKTYMTETHAVTICACMLQLLPHAQSTCLQTQPSPNTLETP